MSDTPSERALQRIKDEMAKQRLSQRDIADLLRWSQSKVSKVMKRRSVLGVDDLSALCFAVGIPMTEVLRDRGMEFYAEMTPTEVRALEMLRSLAPEYREAFLLMLRANIPEIRRATPTKSILGKPRPR